MDINSVITHLIAFLIGALAAIGFGQCMYFIYNLIKKHWHYNCLSSEQDIAIHEAGHILAWLKYCPWWTNEYAYSQHAEHMNYVCINPRTKSGYLNMNGVYIDFNKDVNKYLLLGGITSTMLYYGHRPTLLNLLFYKYFRGCSSDLNRIRAIGMSNREACVWIQEQMTDIDEYDREFLDGVAKHLVKYSVEDDNGTKIISKSRLKSYAKAYRAGAAIVYDGRPHKTR